MASNSPSPDPYSRPRYGDYDVPKSWEEDNSDYEDIDLWKLAAEGQNESSDDEDEVPPAAHLPYVPPPNPPNPRRSRAPRVLVPALDVPSLSTSSWVLSPGSDLPNPLVSVGAEGGEANSNSIGSLSSSHSDFTVLHFPEGHPNPISQSADLYEEPPYANMSSSLNMYTSGRVTGNKLASGKTPKRSQGEKLSAKAARIKELSSSLLNALSLSDGAQATRPKTRRRPPPPNTSMIDLLSEPSYTRACTVFLEGCMAVGKTTLLNYIRRSSPPDEVMTIPEPVQYWTQVYQNVLEEIVRIHKQWKPGKLSSSAALVACQLKFATPLKSQCCYVKHCVQEDAGRRAVAPLDRWVVCDRHPLSALVVFPLVWLRRGMLSFGDFLDLLAMFEANVGEVIVLISIPTDENMIRLQKRGRACEQHINLPYLKEIRGSFHAAYCAWLFLQYFPVEVTMKLCLQQMTMENACAISKKVSLDTAQKMWGNSLFTTLSDVIGPFTYDPTILQVCLHFCYQLIKLQFLVIDLSPFQDDLTGAWSEIYMQVMKNSDIKTRMLNLAAIKALSDEAHNCSVSID
ncbi:thymidine kinase-like protein [Ovine gammaherpesvirus 2]|uniref:Thymidine kinase-like protein n=1 Tax=Ovine gammaherpesvirus 2 TaxID=10398 RepID=A1BM10_9GAMA|nr:thymidine kinase-like protein [Ovine gammaherpesvirus 2]